MAEGTTSAASNAPTGAPQPAPASTASGPTLLPTHGALSEKQPQLEPTTIPSNMPPLDQIELVGAEDPKNWSPQVKWTYVAVISLAGFISPMGSSIVVPGAHSLDNDFNLDLPLEELLPVSVYVLGLGIGPFLLAPISELRGRKNVYLVSSWIFVVLNLGCIFTHHSFVALNIVRFFAGAAGSAGPSLGAGSIADMFLPSERGKAQSLYALGPLLGPVIGNVVGGWVAQEAKTWRWLLAVLTICSFVIAVIFTFTLKETYQPVLLRQKRQAYAKEWARNHRIPLTSLTLTDAEKEAAARVPKWRRHLTLSPDARLKLNQAFSRPFRLLFTNPVCAIFSLHLGFCYGISFLFLTQHPLLFERRERDEYRDLLRAELAGWGIDYDDVRGNSTFFKEHGLDWSRRQDDDDLNLPGPGGSFNMSDIPPDYGSGSGSGSFMDGSGSGDPLPQLPNFGWSSGVAGLTYLGLGAGFLVSALINTFMQDAIYQRLAASDGQLGWFLLKSPEEIRQIMEERELRRAERRVRRAAVDANALDDREADTDVENDAADLDGLTLPATSLPVNEHTWPGRRGSAASTAHEGSVADVAGRSSSDLGSTRNHRLRVSAGPVIPTSLPSADSQEGVASTTIASSSLTAAHKPKAQSSGLSLDAERDGKKEVRGQDEEEEDDDDDDDDQNHSRRKNGGGGSGSGLGSKSEDKLTPFASISKVPSASEKPLGTNATITDPTSTTAATTALPASSKADSTKKKGRPEYRLPLCLLGMCLLPIGLLCFGWSAQSKTHWLLPMLGSFLTGMATILCFQTILVFLIDAFVPFSASAAACAVLVRSLLAAAFPLFAGRMYARIGFGWGSSLLALTAALGIPVPIVLFRYGEQLRNRHQFKG
ncbi:hypothetical protein A4X06_0g8296 [Tilletia controversa]|uniref:Major facilitator superfamily (MFS) profile domain-containing protein n=1 Tax=Tilletia controversa TaxID=13291 RepID=A0A8X7MKL0_9BASI|nr:hypothetical protein A4X06_0g8296 [Tilletia controversa]